jgi:hypothetical protein
VEKFFLPFFVKYFINEFPLCCLFSPCLSTLNFYSSKLEKCSTYTITSSDVTNLARKSPINKKGSKSRKGPKNRKSPKNRTSATSHWLNIFRTSKSATSTKEKSEKKVRALSRSFFSEKLFNFKILNNKLSVTH